MVRRSLVVGLATLAMSLFVGAGASAAEPAAPPKAAADQDQHTGTVVSASDGKLTMTSADGKEHSHDIGPDVKVHINGQAGKLTDLKKGDKITVTTNKAGKVTMVSHGMAKKGSR